MEPRPPCPIVQVTFSLDRPRLVLLQMVEGRAEQEGNRLLRHWSEALGPNEAFDVRVESVFENGYRIETLHHLRSYVPDGTIRSHILRHLRGHCMTADLAADVQGWPPQNQVSLWLMRWIQQCLAADMHNPLARGRAEYASHLLRLLQLDYPALEAVRLALKDVPPDEEAEVRRGAVTGYRQACLILKRSGGET